MPQIIITISNKHHLPQIDFRYLKWLYILVFSVNNNHSLAYVEYYYLQNY